MLIYKMLNLDTEKQNIISFVGGGGKTTSINALAKEFKYIGKKVLITTTTKILCSEHENNDYFILGNPSIDFSPKSGSITVLGDSIKYGKIQGLSLNQLEDIHKRNIFDIILIEADGANNKPIKAPAKYEPVVPNFTTMTIGLIGLDSFGKPLDEDNVHRSEILADILDADYPHKINHEDIVKLVLHKDGLFKGGYGEKILLLNKANSEDRVVLGKEIKQRLYDVGLNNVYITNMKNTNVPQDQGG